MVMIEMVVAMAILASVMLPLAFSFIQEQRLARLYYFRAVAIEIIDGEMEVLMAGEWRGFSKGAHEYHVHANASRNLPPGHFLLSLDDTQLRLEWRPAKRGKGGPVWRAAPILKAAPAGQGAQ